jgi:predicted RNA-binding Zn-ribbon protein involved in translation (DUF1610 family)
VILGLDNLLLMAYNTDYNENKFGCQMKAKKIVKKKVYACPACGEKELHFETFTNNAGKLGQGLVCFCSLHIVKNGQMADIWYNDDIFYSTKGRFDINSPQETLDKLKTKFAGIKDKKCPMCGKRGELMGKKTDTKSKTEKYYYQCQGNSDFENDCEDQGCEKYFFSDGTVIVDFDSNTAIAVLPDDYDKSMILK